MVNATSTSVRHPWTATTVWGWRLELLLGLTTVVLMAVSRALLPSGPLLVALLGAILFLGNPTWRTKFEHSARQNHQTARLHFTITDRVRGLEITGPLNTAKDFDAIWEGSNSSKAGEAIMQDLCAIPGIGVATSRYLLLLLGGPYVKPDRMTMRFVQRVLNNGNILEADTMRILEAAIHQALDEESWGYSTPRIDHLIWQVESGRLHLPNRPRYPEDNSGDFEL